MSSITINEAQGFSQFEKEDRHALNGAPIDQLTSLLPFKPIRGHGKELSFADASALEDHAVAVGTNGQTIPTSIPTLTTQQSTLSYIAARIEIDGLVAGQYSSLHDIVKAQIDLKTAAVMARFQQLLITGDSANPGEFDGLETLSSGVVLSAGNGEPNGGTVLPGEIEAIVNLLPVSDGNRGRYLVMSPETLTHLHRNNYSQQIYTVRDARLGDLPAISGTPILLNSRIPDVQAGTNPNTKSAYAVLLGEGRGLCGLVPSRSRGREIKVSGPFPSETTGTLFLEVATVLGLTAYVIPAVTQLANIAYNN